MNQQELTSEVVGTEKDYKFEYESMLQFCNDRENEFKKAKKQYEELKEKIESELYYLQAENELLLKRVESFEKKFRNKRVLLKLIGQLTSNLEQDV